MPQVKVTVHKDVEHHETAVHYARLLQDWKTTGVLPAHFGRDGQWELNKRTVQSNIFKLHIRLPDEPGWNDHIHRTSSDKGYPYEFTSAEQLLLDFFNHVDRVIAEQQRGKK
ncbi:TPA: type II toxin-antitoxin system YafO family toxin [Escherichia coli]